MILVFEESYFVLAVFVYAVEFLLQYWTILAYNWENFVCLG